MIQRWVASNAKLQTIGSFEDLVGIKFEKFFVENKKRCIDAWNDYVAVLKKTNKDKRESVNRERLAQIKKEINKSKRDARRHPCKIPSVQTNIAELSDMFRMYELGQFSNEMFMDAFWVRFKDDIDASKCRHNERIGNGYNSIDWEKAKNNPLISQLIKK